MAQSRHSSLHRTCLLSGVKTTSHHKPLSDCRFFDRRLRDVRAPRTFSASKNYFSTHVKTCRDAINATWFRRPLTISRWTHQRPPHRAAAMWETQRSRRAIDNRSTTLVSTRRAARLVLNVRFCGRYWGQSGHRLVHRTCLLLTQSGH